MLEVRPSLLSRQTRPKHQLQSSMVVTCKSCGGRWLVADFCQWKGEQVLQFKGYHLHRVELVSIKQSTRIGFRVTFKLVCRADKRPVPNYIDKALHTSALFLILDDETNIDTELNQTPDRHSSKVYPQTTSTIECPVHEDSYSALGRQVQIHETTPRVDNCGLDGTDRDTK